MKKQLIILALLSIFILLLSACSQYEDEETAAVGHSSAEVAKFAVYGIETHIYLSERIHLAIPAGRLVQGSINHERTIFYYYIDIRDFPYITTTIASHDVDTGDAWHMELPFTPGTEVVGITVTDSGDVGIFAVEHIDDEHESSITAFYAEYDIEGNELSRRYFENLLDYEARTISVEQVIFTDSHVVLLVSHLEMRRYRSTIHIIDIESDEVAMLYSDSTFFRNSLAYIGDGRIALREFLGAGTLFTIISLTEGTWGETLTTTSTVIFSVFEACRASPFDLMMSDDNYLFGYSSEHGEFTTVLNFAESGIHRASNIGFFDDGCIYVLSLFWDNENERQDVNLYILTPAEREVLDGRIILTLGGIDIAENIHQAVMRFNIASSTHEIVIEEYNPTGLPGYQHEGLYSRLQIELMTGGGPDIVYRAWGAVADAGLLLDLHPFILADRELSIDDFVPSFLASLESSCGALHMVANEFIVDTMFSTARVLGDMGIESWTVERFLEVLEDNLYMEYPLGTAFTSYFIIWDMLRADPDAFICLTTHEANFDSENFINILNLGKYANDLLPSERMPESFFRLARGEQFIMRVIAGSVGMYRDLYLIVEDFVPIGFPTSSGGVHLVFPWSAPLGINAATEHPDAAWEFLRHIMLPHDGISMIFPLRTDMLDEFIENITTAWYGEDDDGNRIELSTGTIHFMDGNVLTVYSASEEIGDTIRQILATAQSNNNDLLGELFFGVLERDLPQFFAGTRTTEETARIMQNRAQLFLAERAG
ncbi:MAG: hypothetical protein FWC20_09955 [Oscillospiraceae bacterium]|nr:hypothetical protein [Oscillospiraceae bacterium]MCL2279711.1 hypothetical protein [Oscillospiraceae bacterium]